MRDKPPFRPAPTERRSRRAPLDTAPLCDEPPLRLPDDPLGRLPGTPEAVYRIASDHDVYRARSAISRVMDGLSPRAIRKTRLVTAVSEILRNGLIYGGGACVEVSLDRAGGMIWIDCTDGGPGIADLDQALRDGYTSGKGLGRGLGGAKRLADRFDIYSVPGTGTRVRLGGSA